MKKRKLTRAFLIVGLLVAVALIASPAMGASDKLSVKKMKVSVWPEYDDPRVMVTYQGEFKDGSVFPQGVKFPVPLGSEMNMVCALKPPNEEHLCQLYDTLTGSDDLSISYTLPIPTYYLEYYWDGIKGLPDKSFTFKYVSPYAIDTLELEVQQPLKATNFKLAQPYASATSDGLGMKYYHYAFNNVTPGQVISVDASYTKPDSKPSVAKKPASGSGGSSASGAGGSSTYAFMGIGAALLAVATVGFLLLRRKPVAAPVRTPPVQSRKAARVEARRIEAQRAHRQEIFRTARPEPVPRAAPPSAPRPQGGGAFCTQCGTRLAAGSQFCHVCGSKAKGAAQV
ncbi:MAG: zinc ribbon domain-containing protein [Dehalococcoidales bacterium]|nr:zinc ribbon domain-containing protein [Dehalococcoidales bacterium]